MGWEKWVIQTYGKRNPTEQYSTANCQVPSANYFQYTKKSKQSRLSSHALGIIILEKS